MKEERMIRVEGSQKNSDGEESKIQLATMGNVYEKNQHIYVVYEETEISGMEGTTTTLKIDENNRVCIKRYGNTASQMIFEEGKRHTSDYRTLYGDFKMEVLTNLLDVQIDSKALRGTIKIHYDLSISGLVETQNQLYISF